MRLVFMGTPDYAVPTLRALHGAGHEIAAVYSQPPRPAGRRGLETRPSPVHRAALDLGIDVFTPTTLKGEADQRAFAGLDADAAVVVAYGLLLPEAILAAPRFGAWNGHASLLPRWRGAAPIQRAIMAGDTETGVMIMKMDKGLDTGPVALTGKCPIPEDMTAGELHDRLSHLTAELMVEAMARLAESGLETVAQSEEGVTYAAKIDKAETRIDFARPARRLHDHIRGLSPFPGAWLEMPLGGKSERVKVLASELVDGEVEKGAPGTILDDRLAVACAEGAIRLTLLQKAGGKPMNAADFLRGNDVPAGTVIG